MTKKLSPAFVALTQDALLKAIWYKDSMRMFLIQHRISESALAQWHSDQTKRDFIAWLLPKLVNSDKGQNANRAEGRQIDGSITIDGTTFLIEAKLVNDPIGSPDIDIFMAKIESKADNTMGLFISLSGFNEGAKKTASKQRTPMLLVDSGHIFNLVMRGVMSFPQVIARIKRHAHQTGSSYLSASEF